jgi:hypothetical protein
MAVDQLASALDLYKSATGWVGGYWTFFSGVSLAVVGLVFSRKADLPGRGKFALGLAYVLFAGANSVPMGKAAAVRISAQETAVASLPAPSGEAQTKYNALVESLDAPPLWRVLGWYGVLTLMVTVGIYFQHRHERIVAARERAREGKPSAS